MNIHIDTAIFSIQQQGGISRLWRCLLPALRDAMPDVTFDPAQPPDVFMSTYYKSAPLGVRSVAVVYDMIHERYPHIGMNHPDAVDKRRAIASASGIVAISEMVARDVQTMCGKAATVAYPGVVRDFGAVMPGDVQRFQHYIGKPYVLLVGKRGLYKNAQALYQAWKLWAGKDSFKVVAIGGEEPSAADKAFAAHYDWQQLRLDDHDLQLAYAGASALAYPSLMEGFGLPIAEAMACACPVVCDHELHEIAGDAAYYCDVTRPRDIARALNATLDPSHRMTSITACKQWAVRYTWDGMAQQIAEALRVVA